MGDRNPSYKELVAMLHRAVDENNATVLSDVQAISALGGCTLEDIVRDLLRPLLRDWLDRQLPIMVEQQVAAAVRERLSETGLATPWPPPV